MNGAEQTKQAELAAVVATVEAVARAVEVAMAPLLLVPGVSPHVTLATGLSVEVVQACAAFWRVPATAQLYTLGLEPLLLVAAHRPGKLAMSIQGTRPWRAGDVVTR